MWRAIWRPEFTRIAISGLAKNVGKTTVLNTLLAEGARRGYQLGVLSIGVDGEKHDVWSYRAKPAVYLPPNCFAVTAEQALKESELEYTILQRLPRVTPLGPNFLIRTMGQGRYKLAGQSRVGDLPAIWRRLKQDGATHLLIDGAYDRITAAKPGLVDGLILSVGASIHPSLPLVVQAVEARLLPLFLPEASLLPSPFQTFYREHVRVAQDQLWLWQGEHGRSWSGVWSQSVAEILAAIPPTGAVAIYLNGALTEQRLQLLTRRNPQLHLVLQDHTRWFLSMEEARSFYRRGGQIYVQQQLPLLAMTMNADSAAGYFFEPEEMAAALRQVLPASIPLLDVVRQRCY